MYFRRYHSTFGMVMCLGTSICIRYLSQFVPNNFLLRLAYHYCKTCLNHVNVIIVCWSKYSKRVAAQVRNAYSLWIYLYIQIFSDTNIRITFLTQIYSNIHLYCFFFCLSFVVLYIEQKSPQTTAEIIQFSILGQSKDPTFVNKIFLPNTIL